MKKSENGLCFYGFLKTDFPNEKVSFSLIIRLSDIEALFLGPHLEFSQRKHVYILQTNKTRFRIFTTVGKLICIYPIQKETR